jgi:hypothetical protein
LAEKPQGNGTHLFFCQFLTSFEGIPAMSPNELQNAEGKLVLDEDFPWARLGDLKFRETLEAIVLAMEATTQQEGPSPDASPMKPRPEVAAPLSVSKDQSESAAINPAK